MVMDKHLKSYKYYKYPATFLKWFYVCADCVYLRHFAKSRTCTCVCTFLPLYAVFRFIIIIIIHTLPHFGLIDLSIVRPHSIAFEPDQVTVHWHRE